MNKKMMIVSSVLTVMVVAFIGLNMQKEQQETKVHKYADARLGALKLQEGIEVKIAFLLDEIKESNVKPTEKGLTQLVQSITTIRAYGKDISKEAKSNLHEMIVILKSNGFKNEPLLKKMNELVHSSQKLIG